MQVDAASNSNPNFSYQKPVRNMRPSDLIATYVPNVNRVYWPRRKGCKVYAMSLVQPTSAAGEQPSRRIARDGGRLSPGFCGKITAVVLHVGLLFYSAFGRFRRFRCSSLHNLFPLHLTIDHPGVIIREYQT
jgi:hypothetical protein